MPHHDHEEFSATQDRTRSARVYLFALMPGILAFVTFLTLVETIRGGLEPSIWIVNAGFWLAHGTLVLCVLRGILEAQRAAGATFIAFGVLELAAMYSSPDPIGASASLTFFVVASAYFLSGRATIAFAVAATIVITIAAHTDPTWPFAFAFPSTAFVTLATGLLAAFMMSRSRRTEGRLEQVARDERAARERLEQVDRARDRLIANVSHELRTPLTSTIGSIETLMRDDLELDDRQRTQLMRVARDGGHRLLALVEDLLTIGATRPDSLQLSTEPEHLGELARDALVGIDAGPGRRIELRVDTDPLVRVDRLRLLQVIANLAVNAVRHGQGDVVVQTSEHDDRAVLRVIDDGPGVAPEHVNELFLPFARFSTRPDSTGLGLAICRTLVEAHDGTIEYARTGDGRTCFEVTLPVVGSRVARSDPADRA